MNSNITFTNTTAASPPITTSNAPIVSGNNGIIIAIEVLFSAFVVLALGFCYYIGRKKRRLIRKEHQDMLERALEYQEDRIQRRILHNESCSTIVQVPPPIYSPPDPVYRLSNDAVLRLDHLFLVQNQLSTPNSQQSFVKLPKYSELYGS
ncbi:hypothetical protein K501DRAFT_331908 [Backusella circina FSU 941]|nr:hypothetical protein K501DRAFT_331908 [Backusella circina FSU 941]